VQVFSASGSVSFSLVFQFVTTVYSFFSERIPAAERSMATSSDSSLLDYSSSSSEDFSYLDESIDADSCDGLPAFQSRSADETELPSHLMQPLYEGADVTVIESSILMLQFSIRHRLSTKALGDLIQLLTLHLPKSGSSQCSQSKYKLKKLFTRVLLR
jgi:hypothetical protein